MKVLMQDKESGLLTALFRWQPGTELPLHEHVEVEQTYVLERRDRGRRGRGQRRQLRVASARQSSRGACAAGRAGAELFLKPNLFIEGYAGQTLE